jgi:hypothetical protein
MEFYQGLFGLPLQTQQGTQTATLRSVRDRTTSA